MSEYTPKVGDKVRATLGENVLVGIVRDTDQDSTEVAVSDCRSWTTVWHHDGWQFEQVVEVPTKFGAVIRRADGVQFTLAEPDASDTLTWFGRSAGWASPDVATSGGFTVLFEGVDE